MKTAKTQAGALFRRLCRELGGVPPRPQDELPVRIDKCKPLTGLWYRLSQDAQQAVCFEMPKHAAGLLALARALDDIALYLRIRADQFEHFDNHGQPKAVRHRRIRDFDRN